MISLSGIVIARLATSAMMLTWRTSPRSECWSIPDSPLPRKSMGFWSDSASYSVSYHE